MASRGGVVFAFRHVKGPPSCGPNSSFSIRRILDLPEENVEECASSSSNSSPAENCSVSFSFIPRAVLPMVHHYGDNVPCSGLIDWQEFGLKPYTHDWGYGPFPFSDQGFPLGKPNHVVVFDVHVIPSAERQRNVQFSFLAMFLESRVN